MRVASAARSYGLPFSMRSSDITFAAASPPSPVTTTSPMSVRGPAAIVSVNVTSSGARVAVKRGSMTG